MASSPSNLIGSRPLKVTFSIMLLLLVACGDGENNQSSPDQNIQPVAKSSIWTISSSPASFPTNYSIRLNDLEAVDTCQDPAQRSMLEHQERLLIDFVFDYIPSGALKIEIRDLGEDCTNNAIFHSEDGTLYGIIAMRTNNEEPTISVSAKLNN